MERPFGARPGDGPALSGDEVDDIVAFLKTLTDGWRFGTEEVPNTASVR